MFGHDGCIDAKGGTVGGASTVRQRTVGWIVWLACTVWAGAAVAQSDGGAEEGCEAGVVALDGSEQAATLTGSVSELVARTNCTALSEQTLQQRLADRQTPEPASEAASQFSGLGSKVAAGVEKFFYKGADPAISALKPIFDLGANHLEVLARRPDYADQVFQAGVVLVRAYLKRDDTQQASDVADRLVTLFPSRKPSTETVPPDAVEFIEKRRDTITKDGTKLKVLKLDRAGCKAFINGVPADEKPYPVASNQTYHVTMDCGSSIGPVWAANPPKGQTLEAPVTDSPPLEHRMTNANFEGRTRTEGILRIIAFWAELPQVLGVSSKGPSGEDSFLLVRQQPPGNASWSDGSESEDLGQALSKVWPEKAKKAGGAWKRPVGRPGARAGKGRTIAGWALAGSGVALSGGFLTYLLAKVEPTRRLVLCSPSNSKGLDPDSPKCSGVESRPFNSKEELQTFSNEVNTARVASFTGVGIGVAALTTGVVLLATNPEASKDTGNARLFIGPGPTRAGASLNIQF